MANMVARPESLQDYLDHQLSWFDLDEETRRMADRIIYNLDSNGYLKSPLEDLIPPAPPEVNGNAEAWRGAAARDGRAGARRGAATRSAGRWSPAASKNACCSS